MSTSLQVRSMYRSFLRELPHRKISEISNSPLHQRVRNSILSSNVETPIELASQFLQYFKAQRQYVTLLERYNPGMGLDESERVRLTARRVGMELPKDSTESNGHEDISEAKKSARI